MAGLASQHGVQGARCRRSRGGDETGAWRPVMVAGWVSTAFLREAGPAGMCSPSCPQGSVPARRLSLFMFILLTDPFPLIVACLSFRDLPRSGLNFLVNSQADKNHWKR